MFLRYHLTSINLFFILIILIFVFINKSYAEYSKIWEKVSPSIVSVLPTWPGYDKPGFGAPFGTSPEGSGIVIHDEKGIILTASHVINRALEVSVRDINGTIKQAEIIFDDPKIDIALLKTRKIGKSISISKKGSKIGSKVCILSNSFGLDINITCGIISGKNISGIGFNEIEDFIQTDAAANPGSSGGALVSIDGKLIGMVSAIFTKETDTNVGVNFAISTNLILKTINKLNY